MNTEDTWFLAYIPLLGHWMSGKKSNLYLYTPVSTGQQHTRPKTLNREGAIAVQLESALHDGVRNIGKTNFCP